MVPNLLPNSNQNSLNNFNSVKSKKFQTHTRKLIQIALELLLKSQVPAVQYIALTTINRLFDIYVYHGLFYPGYYESCYIPLSKRKTSNNITHNRNLFNNNTEKVEKEKSPNTNTEDNQDSSIVEKNKDIEVSPSFQLSKKLIKNNDTSPTSYTKTAYNNSQYCSCVRPSRKNTAIEYRIKGIYHFLSSNINFHYLSFYFF
jgi:hypothetical protein